MIAIPQAKPDASISLKLHVSTMNVPHKMVVYYTSPIEFNTNLGLIDTHTHTISQHIFLVYLKLKLREALENTREG